MAKVYTLQDTKSMESKKIQGQGYRLGSVCEQEFEEALHDSIKSNSELSNDFKILQVVYSKFSNNIKQKNAQLQRNLKQADTDIYSHAQQHISVVKKLGKEISNYKFKNNHQQIVINDYNIKLDSIQNTLSEKLSELELLQSEIKTLEAKLDLAQKDLSMKESEIELPSGEAKLRISDSSAVSGGNKKNISNVSQTNHTDILLIFTLVKGIKPDNLNLKELLFLNIYRNYDTIYEIERSKTDIENVEYNETKELQKSKPTRPTRTSNPSQSTTEFDSYGGSNPTANPSTSYSNYSNSNSNDPEQKPLWKNIEKNYKERKEKEQQRLLEEEMRQREFERQQVDQAAMEREQQKEQESLKKLENILKVFMILRLKLSYLSFTSITYKHVT
nr:3410_t:CDS:2 [Entrophospora candida]